MIRGVQSLSRNVLVETRALYSVKSAKRNYSTYGKMEYIKQLREATQTSLGKCKDAYSKFPDDYPAALKWITDSSVEMGMKKAGKLGSRIAAEGKIGISQDNGVLAIVEVNCESDFVSRNSMFDNIITTAAAEATKTNDLESLRASQSVNEVILTAVSKLGEKIDLRRVDRIAIKETDVCGHYSHGGKVGCIVCLSNLQDLGKKEEVGKFARQLASHIAGMNPKDNEELLGQNFIFNDSMTIRNCIEEHGVDLSTFIRYEAGEGIEKRSEDFGEEVAKIVGKTL